MTLQKYGSNNVRVLAGAKGDPGVIGNTGPTGPAASGGATGPTGPTGLVGATGPASAIGNTGPAGNTGAASPTLLYSRADKSTMIVPCTVAGAIKQYTGVNVTVRLYEGNSQIDISGLTLSFDLDNCTVSQSPELVGNVKGRIVQLTNLSTTEGSVLIKTPYSGITLENMVNVLKSLDGVTGATGAGGSIGTAGPQGNTGNTGGVGAIGPQGNTGNTGGTGAIGAVGSQGVTGNTGNTGLVGPTGPPTGDEGIYHAMITLSTASLKHTDILTGYTFGTNLGSDYVSIPVKIVSKNNIGVTDFDFGAAELHVGHSPGSNTFCSFSNTFLESSSDTVQIKGADDDDDAQGTGFHVWADAVAGTGLGGIITVDVYYMIYGSAAP